MCKKHLKFVNKVQSLGLLELTDLVRTIVKAFGDKHFVPTKGYSDAMVEIVNDLSTINLDTLTLF